MIEIDGSYAEGGGQILRTSMALSALTGMAFEINNIRSGRPNPGLKQQHVYGAKFLEKFCSATVCGADEGSQSMTFYPGKLTGQTIEFDMGTAASIPLLLQTVILPSCFGQKKSRFVFVGGTDVDWSMSTDYFREVILPHFKKLAEFELNIQQRGYYPAGGGKVTFQVRPKLSHPLGDIDKILEEARILGPINIPQSMTVLKIGGISHSSLDLEKAGVAQRQAEAARLALKSTACPVSIEAQYQKTLSTGSGITLWALFANSHDFARKDESDNLLNEFSGPKIIGADSLGIRGKSSEEVASVAVQNLMQELQCGSQVDRHLADNLVPLLGLFGGEFTTSRITNHTLANIYVTEKFLPVKFSVDGNNVTAKLN